MTITHGWPLKVGRFFDLTNTMIAFMTLSWIIARRAGRSFLYHTNHLTYHRFPLRPATKAATLFILSGYPHAKTAASLCGSQKETRRKKDVLSVLFPGSSDHTTSSQAPPVFEDKGFFCLPPSDKWGPPAHRTKNIPL